MKILQKWFARWQRQREDRQMVSILKFLNTVDNGASGMQISKHCRMLSGTLYPRLSQMEAHGIITSDWEDGDHYPRRRLYKSAIPSYMQKENAL